MKQESPLEQPLAATGPAGRTTLSRVLSDARFPADKWRIGRYKAGECIIREGDNSGLLYVIEAGAVRVEGTVRLASGRRFQAGVTKLSEGSVLGELALFDAQPHSASVFADTDTIIAEIDGNALLTFLDENRELGYLVFREFLCQLAPRLRATSARVYKFLAWGLNAYRLDG